MNLELRIDMNEMKKKLIADPLFSCNNELLRLLLVMIKI